MDARLWLLLTALLAASFGVVYGLVYLASVIFDVSMVDAAGVAFCVGVCARFLLMAIRRWRQAAGM